MTSDDEPDADLIDTIREYCYQRGVLVWSAGRHSNVLRFIPPLVITSDQAEIAMDIVTDAIEECADTE